MGSEGSKLGAKQSDHNSLVSSPSTCARLKTIWGNCALLAGVEALLLVGWVGWYSPITECGNLLYLLYSHCCTPSQNYPPSLVFHIIYWALSFKLLFPWWQPKVKVQPIKSPWSPDWCSKDSTYLPGYWNSSMNDVIPKGEYNASCFTQHQRHTAQSF